MSDMNIDIDAVPTVNVILSNIANGPRGVHLSNGNQIVVPMKAKSDKVTVTEGELQSLRESNNFQIEEFGPGQPVVLPVAQVKAGRMKKILDDIEALKNNTVSESIDPAVLEGMVKAELETVKKANEAVVEKLDSRIRALEEAFAKLRTQQVNPPSNRR